MQINIQEEVRDILEEYSKDLKRIVNNAEDKVAKETKQKVSDSASRLFGSGQYSKGFAVKRERGKLGINKVIVYNKTTPQLTHLLEKGHEIYNGSGGSYGRVSGRKHIEPAEKWAIEELSREIERNLK